MTLFYAHTSAVIRTYLTDGGELGELLLNGPDPVVTSELTRVELAAAARESGVADPNVVLDRFDKDCGEGGAFTLLRLDSPVVLPLARRLVTEHAVRTLDAIHLAVALTDGTALAAGEPVVLVTRDQQQAVAAKALGLPVL
ncbi:type II toxin-antitoxin system VapC family toxin [Actinophytocola sp.]|uniref:type II toxin-antitoxin system VapC family toxin n=1 Tax=Actinophytocola sp. TaxID=1872138 RepID=UPI002D7E782C|nr:type II toxin-antitoxin system VapC family toxin [Actinophytocola sp.]HET9142817.1 type II toxin-antitoxin system VapC family toxin [Actinophytocola sp.]